MKALVAAIWIVMTASPAMAGAFDRAKVYDKLGFAQAAVEACPHLKINPDGVLALFQSLDADDQAALASGLSIIERHKQASARLLALLGDAACDAALDFEAKLGIDIFIGS